MHTYTHTYVHTYIHINTYTYKKESQERPDAVSDLKKMIKQGNGLKDLPADKQHFTLEEYEKVMEEVKEAETWMKDSLKVI